MIGKTKCYNSSTHTYTVTPVSNDTSLGTVSGGGTTSSTSTVVATAGGIGRFVNWTVAGIAVSTDTTFTFTPTSDVTIQANFVATIELVSWANGTASQLKDMIDAHYEGKMDLHDYWSVGDTRTVTLPAMSATGFEESHVSQSVQLVLMDTTCTGFTLTTEQVAPAFIVGQKDGLAEKGYMNSQHVNDGGWGDTDRRTWCNGTYKTAMDSVMPNIFKQFTWKYVDGGSDTDLYSANDYFALAPEKSVFGSRTYSKAVEAALFSQWTYYQTATNRIKKAGTSGSANWWWECSPYYNDIECFCAVNSSGATSYDGAKFTYLIAPFGCI